MLRRSDIRCARGFDSERVLFTARVEVHKAGWVFLGSTETEIRAKQNKTGEAVWDAIYGDVREEIVSILGGPAANVLPEKTAKRLKNLARILKWQGESPNEPW